MNFLEVSWPVLTEKGTESSRTSPGHRRAFLDMLCRSGTPGVLLAGDPAISHGLAQGEIGKDSFADRPVLWFGAELLHFIEAKVDPIQSSKRLLETPPSKNRHSLKNPQQDTSGAPC